MPDLTRLSVHRRDVALEDAWRDWDGFVLLEAEEVAAAPKVHLVEPYSASPWSFADAHCVIGRVQAIGCYFLRDVTYAGMLYPFLNGRLLDDGSHLSRVCADWLDKFPQHRPGGTDNNPLRTLSGPVIAVVGPGHQTYGHWVIDFLPRLAVARSLLKERFNEFRFLLLTDTPEWGKDLLEQLFGIGRDRLILFEFAKDEFVCEQLCYPTFAHSYPFFLHSFIERFYRSISHGPFGDRRLCIQRRSTQSGRHFLRQAEFEQRALREGFELVDPGNLPMAGQAELFRSAAVIIGEYGSALHNCVFSSGSTLLGVLNAPGVEQTRLCAVFGQPIVYAVGQADGENWSVTDVQMDRFFAMLRLTDTAPNARSATLSERVRSCSWQLSDHAGMVQSQTVQFREDGRVTGHPDAPDAKWLIDGGRLVLTNAFGTATLSCDERLDFGDEILLCARSKTRGLVLQLASDVSTRRSTPSLADPTLEPLAQAYKGISNPDGVALRIGRFCSIDPSLAIVASDYDPHYVAGYRFAGTAPSPGDAFNRTVTIGNDVRIERGAIIRAGSEIGDGVIVAAGSVVQGLLPPYALVEGNPARVVGYRFSPDQVARLFAVQWWNWPAERIERFRPLMMSRDIDGFLAAAEQT